jgi:hypothetical protein
MSRPRPAQALLLLAAAGGLVLGLRPAAVAAQSPCRSVALRSPVTGETVSGTVAVLGSAQIDGFNFYKVEWAPLSEPESWRAVSDVRHEPVINGLLDQWDTDRAGDGVVRLKLTVVDQAATEVCRVVVEDVVIGGLAAGTATPTETGTPTASPTAADTAAPTEPPEPTAEAPTAAPPAEASPAPAESPPAGEPITTTATTDGTEADGSGDVADGGAMELADLSTAFVGGFCLALLVASALVALAAARGRG